MNNNGELIKNKKRKDALFFTQIIYMGLFLYFSSAIGLPISPGVIAGVAAGILINYFIRRERKTRKYDKVFSFAIIAVFILIMRFGFDCKIYWEKLLVIGPLWVVSVWLLDYVDKFIMNRIKDQAEQSDSDDLRV